jgi:transcriptional regulator with XRE-family HTH domain
MLRGDQHPVRIARKARQWRLVDLAERVGRSVPLLSMIENNGYVPKRSTQLAIADALERPVEEFWPDEEDR